MATKLYDYKFEILTSLLLLARILDPLTGTDLPRDGDSLSCFVVLLIDGMLETEILDDQKTWP